MWYFSSAVFGENDGLMQYCPGVCIVFVVQRLNDNFTYYRRNLFQTWTNFSLGECGRLPEAHYYHIKFFKILVKTYSNESK